MKKYMKGEIKKEKREKIRGLARPAAISYISSQSKLDSPREMEKWKNLNKIIPDPKETDLKKIKSEEKIKN